MASKLRISTYPKEQIVSVEEGATCFVGQATAALINGVECVVIARSVDGLEKAIMSLPESKKQKNATFVREACYKMVTMRYRDCRIDDEL